MLTKTAKRLKIKKRVRGKISGTAERPRLTVFRSNKGIYAQLIDDLAQHTIASASSKSIESSGNKTELANEVGKLIAQRAKKAGVDKIVFDRNGYLYHGRVKSLAEGAREGGLEF